MVSRPIVLSSSSSAFSKRGHDPRTCHAEWVTEGDRAALHVQLLDRYPEMPRRRDHLRGKCLVDLDEVHVVDRHPGALERLAAGADRSETHDLGIERGYAARDDPRERPDPELVGAGRST